MIRLQVLEYQYDGNGTIDWDKSVVGDLDVADHSEFPLALTLSAEDIRKMGAKTGTFSKTFKIPATKNNNKILKSIYIENAITNSNILKKLRCRILSDDSYSLNGLLKITAIGKTDKPSYYSAVFYGSNLAWANGLEEKYLHQIDWGSAGEDLKLDKPNIMASWLQTNSESTTSPVVYPITSYGKYNDGGVIGTMQLLQTAYEATGGSAIRIGYYGYDSNGDSYGNPEPQLDWRPQVWVKDTLDKIFNKLGYTISSNFMNTDMFKQLTWALPNALYNNADERYEDYSFESKLKDNFYSSNISHTNNTGYTQTVGTNIWREFTIIPLATDFDVTLDENLAYNTATGVYTVTENGYYTIKIGGGIGAKISNVSRTDTLYSGISNAYFKIGLKIKTVGESYQNDIWGDTNNFSSTIRTPSNSQPHSGVVPVGKMEYRQYFNTGDEIKLAGKMRFNWTQISLPDGESVSFDLDLGTSYVNGGNSVFNIEFESETMEYGQTYNLKDVISKDYKQLDFIKGISHAFNLDFTTDESTKTIYIEPFNEFYFPLKDSVDWTYRLDRSKEITDKFIETDVKRNIIFKYKTDSKDKKVEHRSKTFFDDIGDEYPYQEELTDEFKKGESKFENPFFAGTYNAKDASTIEYPSDTGLFYTGALWTENVPSTSKSTRSEKGNDYMPRLMYYNTYLNGVGWKYFSLQYWKDGTGGSTQLYNIQIPQASSSDRQNINSPNLHYGNIWVGHYDKTTNTYASNVAKKGLYETYYKGKIHMLKQNPRIREVYVDLKMKDIANLDLRRLVYIDGVYWRINKIVDFKPNQNTTTKVELVEWVQIGDIVASNPTINPYSDNLGNSDVDDNNNLGL